MLRWRQTEPWQTAWGQNHTNTKAGQPRGFILLAERAVGWDGAAGGNTHLQFGADFELELMRERFGNGNFAGAERFGRFALPQLPERFLAADHAHVRGSAHFPIGIGLQRARDEDGRLGAREVL